MKNLLIIGARGYGREVYNNIILSPIADLRIKGFLDDKSDALDGYDGYGAILSSVENYVIEEDDIFFCALGDTHFRAKYTAIIKEKGGIFLTLVHPTAIVHPTAKIGEGVSIWQFCTVSADVQIGDFSFVFAQSTLGHDAIVGKNCSIGAYTFLGGYSQVENNATLHTRSTILPHKKVGENAIVGAGSIVIRNVKADTTVFGNPAKVI